MARRKSTTKAEPTLPIGEEEPVPSSTSAEPGGLVDAPPEPVKATSAPAETIPEKPIAPSKPASKPAPVAKAIARPAESLNKLPIDREAYTVVARRYRPRTFSEVVGQDHVVQSLTNAIKFNRVTHAYLFCGTRGVGKTTIARIFSKCLNCVRGPTVEPCLECDVCTAIAAGQDVDVIEIDGASNNGVEAVREIRQNVGLRPSRSRFKIYYIDEVHMLSSGAFNALLKTLEEPPEHVKFFFATTEAQKIPITVLSRCQRYDLAAIAPDRIVDTLADVCKQEGVEAEREALALIARRASGSMRDAQSLLEQTLSFGSEKLTVDGIHSLLGIAGDDRVLDLLEAIAGRNTAAALQILEEASSRGVQPTEVLGGTIDFLRDVMVLAVKADNVPMLAAAPRQKARLDAIAEAWTLDSILAALQILSEARSRIRGSPHARLIVELAIARVARLENLTDLDEFAARLASLEHSAVASSGESAVALPRTPTPRPQAPPVDGSLDKKKTQSDNPLRRMVQDAESKDAEKAGAVGSDSSNARSALLSSPDKAPATERTVRPDFARKTDEVVSDLQASFTLSEVVDAWKRLPERVGVFIGHKLTQVTPTAVAPPATVVVGCSEDYAWVASECGTDETRGRIENELASVIGKPVSVRFERTLGSVRAEKEREKGATDLFSTDPLVKSVVDLFQAQLAFVERDKEKPEE